MHRTAADQSGVELESSPPLLILEEDRPGEEIALSPEKQRAVFAAQLARERETFRTFFQQKTSLLRESYRKKLERVAGENNSSSIILRDHRHSERAAIPTRRESSRGSSTSTGAAGGGATGGASLEGGGGVRSSSRRYFTSTSEQQEFELMYKFYSSATRTSSNSEDDNLNTQDETEPPRAAASDEQELLRQENARLRYGGTSWKVLRFLLSGIQVKFKFWGGYSGSPTPVAVLAGGSRKRWRGRFHDPSDPDRHALR